MKLKKEYITYDTADESMLVPTADAKFAGLIRGNKTLGAILELLKEETTEDEVVEKMMERFEAPRELIAKDVHTAVMKLREVDALEDGNS